MYTSDNFQVTHSICFQYAALRNECISSINIIYISHIIITIIIYLLGVPLCVFYLRGISI